MIVMIRIDSFPRKLLYSCNCLFNFRDFGDLSDSTCGLRKDLRPRESNSTCSAGGPGSHFDSATHALHGLEHVALPPGHQHHFFYLGN